MIAQKDLAAKLGISRSAVSTILQGGERAEKFRPEMRQKVLEAATKYGYQRNELANAIRSGHNRMFGFVTQSVIHPHVGLLLNGVLAVANDHNYAVRILNTENHDDPEEVARQVIGQCMAGIVVYDISDEKFLSRLYELLTQSQIPIIYAGGASPLTRGIRIESDVEQGGQLAFKHLYELGHRRFLLAISYDWADYSQKLVSGFMTMARQAAEPVTCMTLQDPMELDGMKATNTIVQHKLTACLCNTTHLTLNLMTHLLNHGINVPQKVSIMGRGNMEYSQAVTPKLTMLDEELEQIGKLATQTLLKQLRKDTDESQTLLKIPHRLVKRDSTSQPSKP